MPADPARLRSALDAFEFSRLFNELGWDRFNLSTQVQALGRGFALKGVAQKRGMAVLAYSASQGEPLPDRSTRLRVEREVAKLYREHIVVWADNARDTQVWQWVKREHGRPLACREHPWRKGQSNEPLVQRLQSIGFELEEETDELSLMTVTARVARGLDVDKVTKRFYERFSEEHRKFLSFIEGIAAKADREWYASLMLNRLMFVYFIQKKGFLDGDQDYLPSRLRRVQSESGRGRFHTFYRHFLVRLFHEGLGKHPEERARDLDALLGRIPYLNGGLFDVHEIETGYPDIRIPDEAFEQIFEFFDSYSWHLDDRPLRNDREINPDVLGYIFEKYVNQKDMGAYYTKEDITEYIAKNTLLPFLLERTKTKCRIAFEGEGSVWRLLVANPDRYIYEPVRRGVDAKEDALPDFVRKGMRDPKARMFEKRYNLGAADLKDGAGSPLTLPTETWREYVERRDRCLALRERLARGEVREVGDLITLNLDIRQFMRDVIETSEGPELLRALWHAIVGRIPERSNQDFEHGVTVLDPTCGSGAFLFAALNVLEELYEACLERMEAFVAEAEAKGGIKAGTNSAFFRDVLAEVKRHPNRKYYVYKTIILNNLFGVDIMPEAVEIAKLRLFLKLVSQVDRIEHLEPLPDIDFNLRAGNTLVGFATLDEARRAVKGEGSAKGMNLFADALGTIEEKARDVDRLFLRFREAQVKHGERVSHAQKKALRDRLKALEDELNGYLAGEYGVDPRKKAAYARWLISHKPFHWFVDFYGIMKAGGFDVIVGNPPYVVYPSESVNYKLLDQSYKTLDAKNLYAFVFERSFNLAHKTSPIGLIVQLTSLSSEKVEGLQNLIVSKGRTWVAPFPRRPESVFEGVEMPVAIILSLCGSRHDLYSTRVNRFYSEERSSVMNRLMFYGHSVRLHGHRVAKFGMASDENIYGKVAKFEKTVNELTVKVSDHLLYYQEACRYWAKALSEVPRFLRNGERMDPPHGRTVFFREAEGAAFASCLLNSSLFYWYYSCFSDCEHINDALVRSFPVDQDLQSESWRRLEKKLTKALHETATRKIINTKQGHKIEYEELNASQAKDVIDAIEAKFAEFFGFDDSELDVVANYDIKYRMGQEAVAEED